MKRQALILLITVTGLIASFVDAFYGLLLYTWYSFSSPLELSYGALEGSRLSLLVAVVLILTTLHQRGKLFAKHILTLLSFAFLLACSFSLAYSMQFEFDYILSRMELLAKIVVITCLSPLLIRSLKQLRIFILTIAISGGLLGAYYGAFGLLSGSRNISGPGRLGDNNNYAVFLVALIPYIFYAGRHFPYIKSQTTAGLATCGLLSANILAILLTFSRGGFLALSISGLLLLVSVRSTILKFISWSVIIPSFAFLVWQIFAIDENLFEVPQGERSESIVSETLNSYVSRLRTLKQGIGKIDSANSRTHFWKVAMKMVQDKPLLGVGYSRYPQEYMNYNFHEGQYKPNFGSQRSVHSTFFMVLSETGLIGFSLFTLLLLSSLIILQKVINTCKIHYKEPGAGELIDYANLCRISLVGYCVGSCFVNTLTQETLWAIFTITIVLDRLAASIRAKNQLDSDSTFSDQKQTKHRVVGNAPFLKSTFGSMTLFRSWKSLWSYRRRPEAIC